MPRYVKNHSRVVKARTAKQRANTKQFVKRYGPATFSNPVTPGPATSFWVGASREQLRELVAQERTRMAYSRFGRLIGSGATAD